MSNPTHDMEINRLIKIMATLRSKTGCPWDRQQTPQSLKGYLLEEAYEVLDAIDHHNPIEVCDELGDLLLQVVFLAQIYHEQGLFDFTDVAKSIADKLIRRHPHVFGEADQAHHAERWEAIKRQERETRGQGHSLAERLPKTMPALKTAQKISKKIPLPTAILLQEQIQDNCISLSDQMEQAAPRDDRESPAAIIGHILYQTVQLATTLGVDAEDALRQKNNTLIAATDRKKQTREGHQ